MKEIEIDKIKAIDEEYKRLCELFETIPENQKQILFPLLQNLAFMKITLDSLQVTIIKNGVTEAYQNGANQSGMKTTSEIKTYNSMVKNYNTVVKSVISYLPNEPKQNELMKLMFE